jgi:hypothetical protein
VDVSRIPKRTQEGTHYALGEDAYQASRQVGERMVADEVKWLGNKGRELLGEYNRIQPKHTLNTFTDVENIWHKVILPEIGEYESMKEIWDWQAPIPEDSPWYANMKISDNWR